MSRFQSDLIDKIKNRAIITDIILVIFTILIPIVLLKMNIELNIMIVPIFVILYILFRVINENVHKMYLKNEDEKIEHEIEVEEETATPTPNPDPQPTPEKNDGAVQTGDNVSPMLYAGAAMTAAAVLALIQRKRRKG